MLADRFGHFFPLRPRSGKESRVEFAVKSLAQTVIPESIRSTQLGGAHPDDAFHVGKAILSLICKFNEESFKDCWKEDDKQFLQSVLRQFEDAAKFFNVSAANSAPIYARLKALQNGEHLILPTGYPSKNGEMGHTTYCIIEKNRDAYDFFEINTNGDFENMERSVYLSRGILGKSLRCTTPNAAEKLIASLLKVYEGGYAVGGPNDPPTLGSIYGAIWRNEWLIIRDSKEPEYTRIKLEELNRPRQMVATQRSDNCSFASRDEIIRFLILKEISSKTGKSINEVDVLQAGNLLFRKVMLCIKAYHTMAAVELFKSTCPNPDAFDGKEKEWADYRGNLLRALRGVARDFRKSCQRNNELGKLEEIFSPKLEECRKSLKEERYQKLAIHASSRTTIEQKPLDADIADKTKRVAKSSFEGAMPTEIGVEEMRSVRPKTFFKDIKTKEEILAALNFLIKTDATKEEYAEDAIAVFRNLPSVDDEIWKEFSQQEKITILRSFGDIRNILEKFNFHVTPYENWRLGFQCNQLLFCASDREKLFPMAVENVFMKMRLLNFELVRGEEFFGKALDGYRANDQDFIEICHKSTFYLDDPRDNAERQKLLHFCREHANRKPLLGERLRYGVAGVFGEFIQDLTSHLEGLDSWVKERTTTPKKFLDRDLPLSGWAVFLDEENPLLQDGNPCAEWLELFLGNFYNSFSKESSKTVKKTSSWAFSYGISWTYNPHIEINSYGWENKPQNQVLLQRGNALDVESRDVANDRMNESRYGNAAPPWYEYQFPRLRQWELDRIGVPLCSGKLRTASLLQFLSSNPEFYEDARLPKIVPRKGGIAGCCQWIGGGNSDNIYSEPDLKRAAFESAFLHQLNDELASIPLMEDLEKREAVVFSHLQRLLQEVFEKFHDNVPLHSRKLCPLCYMLHICHEICFFYAKLKGSSENIDSLDERFSLDRRLEFLKEMQQQIDEEKLAASPDERFYVAFTYNECLQEKLFRCEKKGDDHGAETISDEEFQQAFENDIFLKNMEVDGFPKLWYDTLRCFPQACEAYWQKHQEQAERVGRKIWKKRVLADEGNEENLSATKNIPWRLSSSDGKSGIDLITGEVLRNGFLRSIAPASSNATSADYKRIIGHGLFRREKSGGSIFIQGTRYGDIEYVPTYSKSPCPNRNIESEQFFRQWNGSKLLYFPPNFSDKLSPLRALNLPDWCAGNEYTTWVDGNGKVYVFSSENTNQLCYATNDEGNLCEVKPGDTNSIDLARCVEFSNPDSPGKNCIAVFEDTKFQKIFHDQNGDRSEIHFPRYLDRHGETLRLLWDGTYWHLPEPDNHWGLVNEIPINGEGVNPLGGYEHALIFRSTQNSGEDFLLIQREDEITREKGLSICVESTMPSVVEGTAFQGSSKVIYTYFHVPITTHATTGDATQDAVPTNSFRECNLYANSAEGNLRLAYLFLMQSDHKKALHYLMEYAKDGKDISQQSLRILQQIVLSMKTIPSDKKAAFPIEANAAREMSGPLAAICLRALQILSKKIPFDQRFVMLLKEVTRQTFDDSDYLPSALQNIFYAYVGNLDVIPCHMLFSPQEERDFWRLCMAKLDAVQDEVADGKEWRDLCILQGYLDAHRKQLKAVHLQKSIKDLKDKSFHAAKTIQMLQDKRKAIFDSSRENAPCMASKDYGITVKPPPPRRLAFMKMGWEYFGKPDPDALPKQIFAAIERSQAFQDLKTHVDDEFWQKNKQIYLYFLAMEFRQCYRYKLPEDEDEARTFLSERAEFGKELKQRWPKLKNTSAYMIVTRILEEPLLEESLVRWQEKDEKLLSRCGTDDGEVSERLLKETGIVDYWRGQVEFGDSEEKIFKDNGTNDGKSSLALQLKELSESANPESSEEISSEQVTWLKTDDAARQLLSSEEQRAFGAAFVNDLQKLQKELNASLEVDAKRQRTLEKSDVVDQKKQLEDTLNLLIGENGFIRRNRLEEDELFADIEARLNAIPQEHQFAYRRTEQWRKVRLSDAIHAYALLTCNDAMTVGENFPAAVRYLRQRNPHLTKNEVREILQKTVNYMRISNERRQAERLKSSIEGVLQALNNLEQLPNDLSSQEYKVQKQICGELFLSLLDLVRDTEQEISKNQMPYALLFTYVTGMWPRREQIDAIQQLITALIKDKDGFLVRQALMGFGKTKFILPLLMFFTQKRHCIPIVVSHKAQFTTVKQDLGNALSGRLQSELVPIEFDLKDFRDIQKLKWLKKQLQRSLDGEPVSFLAESGTLEALITSYNALSSKQPITSEEDWTRLQLQAWIFDALRQKGAGFFDEVDGTLNPFESLITPENSISGVRNFLPNTQIDFITNIFQQMEKNETFGRFIRENNLQLLTNEQQRDFLQQVASQATDSDSTFFVGDLDEHEVAFQRFILGEIDDNENFELIADEPWYKLKDNLTDDERQRAEQDAKWMLFLRQLEQNPTAEMREKVERICLLRALLTTYLSFSDCVNLNYGYSKDGSLVPYNGPNEPSSNVFKDPIKTAVALCRCISSNTEAGGGIQRSSVENYVREMCIRAVRSEGGTLTSILARQFDEHVEKMMTRAGKSGTLWLQDFDPDSPQRKENWDDLITLLFNIIQENPENRWEFARKWMYGTITYDAQTLEGKPMALPELFKAGVAFSGTTSNVQAYNPCFNADSNRIVDSKGSLGRVINKFRKDITEGRSDIRFASSTKISDIRPLAKILSHSKPHGRRNQRPLKMGLLRATLSERVCSNKTQNTPWIFLKRSREMQPHFVEILAFPRKFLRNFWPALRKSGRNPAKNGAEVGRANSHQHPSWQGRFATTART